jgi:hypothetical protein
VSTLVHANKTTEMSHERGPSSIPTDCLSMYRALNSTTDPTSTRIPRVFLRAEKPVFVSKKFGFNRSILTCGVCVDPCRNFLSRNPENHHCETLSSLLSLFGKPVSIFPVGCDGHAELDCVWLAGQCKL